MGPWTLERLRLAAGLWEGRLTGPAGAEPPTLAATWRGSDLSPPRLAAEGEGRWRVTLELPSAIMTEGTQTLAIGPRGDEPLCLETFDFGDPLEADLRAQLAALRAELDLLKRAFRRHMAGGD
jgi:hypothetical protein